MQHLWTRLHRPLCLTCAGTIESSSTKFTEFAAGSSRVRETLWPSELVGVVRRPPTSSDVDSFSNAGLSVRFEIKPPFVPVIFEESAIEIDRFRDTRLLAATPRSLGDLGIAVLPLETILSVFLSCDEIRETSRKADVRCDLIGVRTGLDAVLL